MARLGSNVVINWSDDQMGLNQEKKRGKNKPFSPLVYLRFNWHLSMLANISAKMQLFVQASSWWWWICTHLLLINSTYGYKKAIYLLVWIREESK